jgi:hypothetical protein
MSMAVFVIWRAIKFRGGAGQPSRYVALPALAVAHFAVVLAVCRALEAWISSGG